MGDLDNEKVKVYVLDACSDECTCSEDECKAERLCEELKQCPECENIEWMFGREWSTESSFLDKVYNSIWRSKNVLILWNTNSRKFVERNEQPKRLCRTLSRSEDENANKTDICLAKFANFYQNTSYVQVDKGYGNVLVHVKLEENAIPKYVRKWEDATTGSAIDIIARIRERVFDFRDLSPCGPVGYGLACTFCLGYLKPQLPGYKSTLEKENFPNAYDKIIVIIPASGRCMKDIPGLTKVKNLCQKRKVAGVDRSYVTTVYKITDGTMVYHAGVEYATPVRALRHMRNLRLAGLSTYWLHKEADTIYNEVQKFLEIYELGDNVDLIDFDDIELDEKNRSDEEYINAVAEPLRKKLVARIQ